MYSVKGRDSAKHPNFNIVLFAAGFSLPTCAAQIVAALFTRIFELDYTDKVLQLMFATDMSLGEHCDPDTEMMANCAFCVFPLLSTFISVAFSGIYLAAAFAVTQRMAAAVINKLLVRRIRLMQLLVMSSMAVSLACRGCTVLFEPFELGFELLRVAHLFCLVGSVVTLCWFLVLKPVYDTHIADRALKEFARKGNSLPDPLLANPLGYAYPAQELHAMDSSTGGSMGQPAVVEEGFRERL
ncbi:hypothetical protein HYH03_018407 [Edaphochlamys debaryana]|uniref:Transmembrane protein n=1 Tax=Edaphochlamys debaryana TaxID=47281 RepID=A0A835XG23_9CHLO|nr:hypothetical protein HYH03_018407 [Edaphochlamys debaryana]|eukprot:KAG2482670.1 hypothetical protein HYH03_018407 [Edaphochlamys debaryana]